MNKFLLYTIVGICGGIGGYIPILLGQDMFSSWNIVGSVVGGLVGISAYKWLRDQGYVE